MITAASCQFCSHVYRCRTSTKMKNCIRRNPPIAVPKFPFFHTCVSSFAIATVPYQDLYHTPSLTRKCFFCTWNILDSSFTTVRTHCDIFMFRRFPKGFKEHSAQGGPISQIGCICFCQVTWPFSPLCCHVRSCMKLL